MLDDGRAGGLDMASSGDSLRISRRGQKASRAQLLRSNGFHHIGK